MTTLRKIPATVVTGFLGAGKTTLLRHLIENSHGKRLALIINEFGDIGIDGTLIRACGNDNCREEDVLELANGCICCTVADEFLPTMEALLSRDRQPDHIIIETSGLALPKPLVRAFQWPEVRTRVTVDGVIAVIDGPAAAAGLFADDPAAIADQRAVDAPPDHDNPLEELFVDQIQCADLVVLNKADLMTDAQGQAARVAIAPHLRAGVEVIGARFGAVDARIVLGLDAAAEDDVEQRWSHHDGLDGHDHDDFDSVQVSLGPVADRTVLGAAARAVLDLPGVLRVKGVAAVDGKPMRLVVQGVGRRLDTYFDRDWAGDEVRNTVLVAIGLKGFDRDAVLSRLTAI